jgi:hypothetical protein
MDQLVLPLVLVLINTIKARLGYFKKLFEMTMTITCKIKGYK